MLQKREKLTLNVAFKPRVPKSHANYCTNLSSQERRKSPDIEFQLTLYNCQAKYFLQSRRPSTNRQPKLDTCCLTSSQNKAVVLLMVIFLKTEWLRRRQAYCPQPTKVSSKSVLICCDKQPNLWPSAYFIQFGFSNTGSCETCLVHVDVTYSKLVIGCYTI